MNIPGQPQVESGQTDDSIFIRQACQADLMAISRIEQACFAIPWSEDSLRSDLARPEIARLWVADSITHGVVGYIACYKAADTAQINNLAVLPGFRCLGIGQRLLEKLLDWALSSHISTVDLEVRPSNRSAIHLYAKAGFSVVGIRRGYYANNQEDAHIMLKNIL